MTDNQIVKEKFLVYLNDLLSTGYIADLCTPEDKDNFSNSVRGELKQAGILDTPENCWDYFIDKVKPAPCQQIQLSANLLLKALLLVAHQSQDPPQGLAPLSCCVAASQVRKFLHVVLCFSPVGDKFRIRARQFPALVNCTSFDWFHTWPGEALVSVAQRFLVSIPALQASLLSTLYSVQGISYSRSAVQAVSATCSSCSLVGPPLKVQSKSCSWPRRCFD